MKITLAHDSFTQQGGAERVAFAFHEMYPEAPFLTIVVDAKMKSLVSGWDIKTSALQPLYDMHPKFQHWLALIPWAVDNLAVPSCDVLLSSSSFFIKGLRKPAGSIHINYCHTPTRFLWIDSEYVKQEVPAAIRPFVRWFLKMLRKGDLRAAKNVDYFIANSKEVQRRIKEIYKKDSEIIYPFIDEYFWKPTKPKGDYFLVAGRLQPHKGNEVVIEAFNKLGLPLHVVGTGRQEAYLKSIAKSNVVFLGKVGDEELRDEFSGARGYVFPQLEDFGLMPLEAAASGTASLGLARGGSLETIIPGQTGELIPEVTIDSVTKAIQNWDESKYQTETLRTHALRFSKAAFEERIRSFVNSKGRSEQLKS